MSNDFGDCDTVELMFPPRWKALSVAVFAIAWASAETIRVPTKRAGAGPLFQIVRHGKWGFMDRTGRVVIAPGFADERDFFHGLAAVELPEGKWGYIDEKGALAIPARFDDVRDFIEDLSPVRTGRKWGYLDTSGRMVVEPAFQSAGEFHEGLARVHLWSKVVCTSGEFTSNDAPFYAFHLLEDDKSELQDVSRKVVSSDISTRPAKLLSRPDSLLPRTSQRVWQQFALRKLLTASTATLIEQGIL